jgi:hypothetical protein
MLAKLKYDPLKFFEESPSIFGALARKRLKKPQTARDREVIAAFIKRMKESQHEDGSWQGATSDTVRTLDILRSLQVPKSEKWVARAIKWLLAQHNGPTAYRQGFFALPESDEYITASMLPTGEVVNSESSMRHIYGELALAVLLRYGERNISEVQTALAAMRGLLVGRYAVKGFYCCGACTAAIWQVLGGVPQATSPRIINDGLETLKQNREEDGTWRRFPYYFTLLSLSRLPYPAARREIRFASERLKRSQRADGGFGQTDREAKTYAAVAALAVL